MMSTDLHDVINAMAARGVFRATTLPGDTWRITWFGGHVMDLEVVGNKVQVEPVLPELSARSQLYRDLRSWIRAQQSEELPEHRRLDARLVSVDVRNRKGDVRLTLQSLQEGSVHTLLDQTLQLINALYLDFLNGPGRLDWVIAAFNLDPDNPRLR